MIEDKSKNLHALEDLKCISAKDDEHKHETSNKKNDTLFLYFTLISGTTPMITGSAVMSWPSPVIPKLLSNNTDVNPIGQPATTVQISMIVAIPAIVGLIGSLLAPFVADLLGRKITLQLLGLLMFLSNIVLAFSTHVILIIISRSVFFVCFLGTLSVVPIYITEVCESHNRAKFGSLWGIYYPIGNLFSYLLGPKYSYRIFTLGIALPLVAFLVLFCFTHETPVYLLSKGRKEECLKVLRSLRDKNSSEIQRDFEEIEASLNVGKNIKRASVFSLFKERRGRIGVMLALIPTLLLHYGSGVLVVVIFLGPIFTAGGSSIPTDIATVIVGSVKFACFGIAPFIVERAGRRFLIIFSAIGCGLFYFLTGIYFFLRHINSPIVDFIEWLPLVGIVSIIVLFSVGIGPLPNPIMGELFSSDLRSVGISFIMTFSGIMVFLFQAGFPLLTEYAGMHWCMWLFAFNCSIGAFFVYLFLPETRGKTIVEIQEIIKNYRFKLRKSV